MYYCHREGGHCGSTKFSYGANDPVPVDIYTLLEESIPEKTHHDCPLPIDVSSMDGDPGKVNAAYALGMHYAEKRNPLAWHYLCIAADAGLGKAQQELGYWHRSDIKLPGEPPAFRLDLRIDNRAAYMWYSLAEDKDTFGAKEAREYISKRLTEAELTQAKEMLKLWRPGRCPAFPKI